MPAINRGPKNAKPRERGSAVIGAQVEGMHCGLVFLRAIHFEDDFDGVAGLHEFQAAVEIGEGEVVGDDGFEVEAAGEEEVFDLKPGFEHFAAIDSEDGGAFEDDIVGEVEGDGFGGEAEEGGRR